MAQKKQLEPELSLEQIREILKRHDGSFGEIADKFGVRASSVSFVLSGRSASKRIVDEARRKALQFLQQERLAAGAA